MRRKINRTSKLSARLLARAVGHDRMMKLRAPASSVYIGGSKKKILRPRVQGPDGELPLSSYEKMQQRDGFSDDILSEGRLAGTHC